ncbi:hypothetical protein Bpfe_018087 [Biomphalaria pfeifferi]|uniref:Uncharacterized protein n=1 Tax=Biomphalaria pfeifferi TaxID=112525 RepID=A0AAD8F6K2_BIOPF|nr:hypothetical protein Bpfe_018087 [Biomphalaria pfeifferi]
MSERRALSKPARRDLEERKKKETSRYAPTGDSPLSALWDRLNKLTKSSGSGKKIVKGLNLLHSSRK